MIIPNLIHQTVKNSLFMLPEYVENCEKIATLNPEWNLKIYTSLECEEFIREEYDSEILRAYLSIDHRYGASRADFFRYLVVYAKGGLYLDIKSTASKPLNNVIRNDDTFVTAYWPDQINGVDLSKIGQHEELNHPEYQNWFILSAQHNPVLERVIEQVLRNLREYRPSKHGVGKIGVLRTTGPIAYSKVVHEFFLNGSVRLSTNDELGFKYTIHKVENSVSPFPHQHKSGHYSSLHVPVVRKSSIYSNLFSLLHRIIIKIKRLFT